MSQKSKTYYPSSVPGEEGSNITIREDETCFLVSIEMPDIDGKDLQVTLNKNVLTISGFRRSRSNSYSDIDEECDRRSAQNAPTKRQRLVRQLEIDPTAVDIERAMASTWNGCYTLYAPKRHPQFKGLVL